MLEGRWKREEFFFIAVGFFVFFNTMTLMTLSFVSRGLLFHTDLTNLDFALLSNSSGKINPPSSQPTLSYRVGAAPLLPSGW